MQTYDIQIPLDQSDLGGPFWLGRCAMLGQKENDGIAELEEVDANTVKWAEEYNAVYFQMLDDGKTLKAIRKATDEDYRRLRIPSWLEGEEVPECCGKPMSFIGQLDDGTVWAEPPPGAKMWWHDTASFYVFTCPQCLSVQAVGQQC